jgi:hypothetical protein
VASGDILKNLELVEKALDISMQIIHNSCLSGAAKDAAWFSALRQKGDPAEGVEADAENPRPAEPLQGEPFVEHAVLYVFLLTTTFQLFYHCPRTVSILPNRDYMPLVILRKKSRLD